MDKRIIGVEIREGDSILLREKSVEFFEPNHAWVRIDNMSIEVADIVNFLRANHLIEPLRIHAMDRILSNL
jgi:hypothetical protein